MKASIKARINSELIRHLYTQFPVSQFASVGALAALLVGLKHEAPSWLLMTWATIHMLVIFSRLIILLSFRNRQPTEEDMPVWGNRFVVGVAVAGAVWGWAAYKLMETTTTVSGHMLIMFAVGGILAGASQSLSSWMRAYFAFCLPMVLPPMFWLIVQNENHYKFMFLLMSFFVVASASLARLSGRTFVESNRLRFENQALVEDLGQEVKIRKVSESQLTDYNNILSELAKQHSFDNVLNSINLMLEKQIQNCKSSIMSLVDGRLMMTSAPSLPTTYSQAVDGLIAEPGEGSSGSAMSINQLVSVEDIRIHPFWKNYKDIALAHGLIACTSLPVHDNEGNAVGTIALYHSEPHAMSEEEYFCLFSAANLAGIVLERKRAEERLHHLAHYDNLTGLPNRALFSDRLKHALARAKRDKKKFALLFMDLDKFKAINDEHGHAVGDSVLKEVARRLRECVRDVDTAARMGGDEFTLLITDVKDSKAPSLVANKIIGLISAPILLEGVEYGLGVSVGISLYPEDGRDADQLIVVADAAMYHSKGLGGNVAIFNSTVKRLNDPNLLKEFSPAADQP